MIFRVHIHSSLHLNGYRRNYYFVVTFECISRNSCAVRCWQNHNFLYALIFVYIFSTHCWTHLCANHTNLRVCLWARAHVCENVRVSVYRFRHCVSSVCWYMQSNLNIVWPLQWSDGEIIFFCIGVYPFSLFLSFTSTFCSHKVYDFFRLFIFK